MSTIRTFGFGAGFAGVVGLVLSLIFIHSGSALLISLIQTGIGVVLVLIGRPQPET